MVTLSFERGTAFVSEMLMAMELTKDLAQLARTITSGKATKWDDAHLRSELGRLHGELEALWAMTKRNVSEAQKNGMPGIGGNIFKLAYTDLIHRLGEVAMRVLDRASLSMEDIGDLPSGKHVYGRIHALAMTIAAGTTQINKNIVAERVLGLPKDR